MTVKSVVLLHGFASSGQSRKASYMRDKFNDLPEYSFRAIDFNPTPDDFKYMTTTGMINRLRQYILDRDLEGFCLVGSSMGALIGMNYAHRFGGVENLLLLAPALSYWPDVTDEEARRWQQTGALKTYHYAFQEEVSLRYDMHLDGLQYQEPVPPAVPITIIHGRHDDVVPIDRSREYAASYPQRVQLLEVNSDHRLNDRLGFIWEHLLRILSG